MERERENEGRRSGGKERREERVKEERVGGEDRKYKGAKEGKEDEWKEYGV